MDGCYILGQGSEEDVRFNITEVISKCYSFEVRAVKSEQLKDIKNILPACW